MKKSYLMVDNFNKRKAHYITFDGIGDDVKVYYNQAIFSDHLGDKKEGVDGHCGWYLFYTKDELVDYDHGYKEYIEKARKLWDRDQPLNVNDLFGYQFNQAEREVEILATTDDLALGWYEMPRGRKFLCIFDRFSKQWIRSQSVKALPKKWINAMTPETYEFIQDEIS